MQLEADEESEEGDSEDDGEDEEAAEVDKDREPQVRVPWTPTLHPPAAAGQTAASSPFPAPVAVVVKAKKPSAVGGRKGAALSSSSSSSSSSSVSFPGAERKPESVSPAELQPLVLQAPPPRVRRVLEAPNTTVNP